MLLCRSYQLPALHDSPERSGCLTVVISPLVSLIQDQIFHLKAADISAEALTAAVSWEAQQDILSRWGAAGLHRTRPGAALVCVARVLPTQPQSQAMSRTHTVPHTRRVRNPGGGEPIRLLYVTPEKVVKSNLLRGLFAQLNREGRLARVVIDEAHCVSQVCVCVCG
jgi:superfamily II DNA helicase RecQ